MNPTKNNLETFSAMEGATARVADANPGEGQVRAGALFSPRQRKRVRILRVLFQNCETRRAAGQPLRSALRRAKSLGLSKRRTYTLHLNWRKSGRAESSLALQWNPRKRNPSPDQIRALLAAASAPGILSAAPAIRQAARAHAVSERTIRRWLSPQALRQLHALYASRRASLRAEKNFSNWLATQ